MAGNPQAMRGSDMLGTLVVCLPSQFSNGALVLKHQGIFQTFDWGEAIWQQAELTRLHWATFFGVEISPYGTGSRGLSQGESLQGPASAPRKRSVRKKRG